MNGITPREAPAAPLDALDVYLTHRGRTWADRAAEATRDAQVAAFRAGYQAGWDARQQAADT